MTKDIAMRLFSRAFLAPVAAGLAVAALPTHAAAHVALVSSSPAANAVATRPMKLTLTFSGDLAPALSGIELVMTSMPGMAHHAAMPIKGFTTTTHGKTLVIMMPRALPAGTYDLTWHAAGADQHRIEGRYSFTVR